MNGFVAKFNPRASGAASLVYSTFVGGGETTGQSTAPSRVAVQKTATAVDAAGTVYVAGNTPSAGFPTTPGAFQTASGGGADDFVLKLDPTGSTLLYSSYLGGSGTETPNVPVAVAIDGTGVVSLAGSTASTDFPVRNAVQSTRAGGTDGFVMKLDTTVAGSSALLWSTYLGTTGTDNARAITQDAAGNVYVAGQTNSAGFPGTASSPIQATPAGSNDGFVTELSAAGAQLWGTYLGGTGSDALTGVALDSAGNIVVAGSTGPGYSGTPGAYQVTHAAGGDVVVAKIAAGGGSLLWSTLYGPGLPKPRPTANVSGVAPHLVVG